MRNAGLDETQTEIKIASGGGGGGLVAVVS